MYDYVIIDPCSPEFNRGSYCYLPYILYSALTEKGYNVYLYEDFPLSRMDYLPPDDNVGQYLIALWSYPQIEASIILDRFLPRDKVSFFGYYPLINYTGFKSYRMSDEDILLGIKTYWKYYEDFSYILLSDCDMHLREYDGMVYPLFTSYGCPNACAFCPACVNCDHHRIIVPEDEVISILANMCRDGRLNIHFTDEDFFFDIDRTYNILNWTKGLDMKFIALAHPKSLLNFIKKYGIEVIVESGMKLVEVGLETFDDDLRKDMHKGSVSVCEELAELCKDKLKIFWLTLTFFPGETIKSLNATGRFLKQYGHKLDEVYDRIATNSTWEGLGQFFQAYRGSIGYDELQEKGHFLSPRGMRLVPSFIPYSFTDSIITKIDMSEEKMEALKRAKHLYNLDEMEISLTEGKFVFDHLHISTPCLLMKEITYFALLAKLEIIA